MRSRYEEMVLLDSAEGSGAKYPRAVAVLEQWNNKLIRVVNCWHRLVHLLPIWQDDECDMEAYARRMVLAVLQSGAKRFVSVHYFPRESSEREIALRIFATSFERVERLLGLTVDDHFIVIGRGEQAWWRSLLAPD